jgi:hypothetical protein
LDVINVVLAEKARTCDRGDLVSQTHEVRRNDGKWLGKIQN